MIAPARHLTALLFATLFLAAACSDDGDSGSDEAPAGVAWGEACAQEYFGKFSYDPSAPEQSCFELINQYRADMGQPALARWTDGEACAVTEATNDATSNDAHGSFGDCGEMAQNTCPGWGSVDQVLGQCLVGMYCEGPSASGEWDSTHGHHMNMVSGNYTKVACGFYQMSDGSYWVNMNFK